MAEEKTEEKKETLSDELKNKMNSRKFLVWLLWSILIIALVIISFIRDNDTILLKGIEYYFFMSAAYIGGNILTKKINSDEKADK